MEKIKNDAMKEFLKSPEFITFFDEITEATSLFAISTSDEHHMAVMQGTDEEIIEALIYVLHNRPKVFGVFMEAITRSIITPIMKLSTKNDEEKQYILNAHRFLEGLEAVTTAVINSVKQSVIGQMDELKDDLNL